jgi:branched-chain amino acid transport system substrate-binding protein
MAEWTKSAWNQGRLPPYRNPHHQGVRYAMKLRMICSALAALTLMLFTTGCDERSRSRGESGNQTTGTAERNAQGDAVWIGVAGPFTGDSSEFGIQIQMGVQLAADEINAKGGINGRPIRLQERDDAGKPAEAQNVATMLATNPKIMAVIGHFNSSCSLAGKPAYTQAQVVLLSPGSTNVTVTQDSEYIFRNIFTDDFQGQQLADYAGQILGSKRVAILYDNDDYGTGLKDSFKNRAAEIDLQIVSETPYGTDTNDFRSQIETIRSSNPDLLLIAGLYKAAGVVAKQARELGVNTQLIGGDGLFSQQFITLGGDAAEGSIVTCPFLFDLGGDRARQFAEAFRAKWNRDPDAWAVLSYDALNIIAQGLEKDGISRETVLKHLQSINSPENAYDGITGKLYFDEQGDCRRPVHVAVVRNGKFVAAEKQLAETEAPEASADAGATQPAEAAAPGEAPASPAEPPAAPTPATAETATTAPGDGR